ncbi:folate-binding protein YgfZ [Hoyosella rhizosphaerae]|nr:folate-binding protein YgfZ [Hoyosella rhizosphaerae]MBN4928252.1 folate-binding protein YgfZ [Hoyosella rhizosphaerae]
MSPLLVSPGAVRPPEGLPDSGVAWHFGDPFPEQRATTQAAAIVDRSHRGVLTVTGPERLTWLHSLTSQHFTELKDGESTESLLLDVNGRIEQHFVATELDGTVWIDTEAEKIDSLLAFLTKMIFWSKVEVNAVPYAVLTLLGPEVPQHDVPAPQLGEAVALPDGGLARKLAWPSEHRWDLLVPRDQLTQWWATATDSGIRPVGTWAFEALRVAGLRPRIGIDTDDRTIPHEARWIGGTAEHGAVHLNKGCYRGQETVARVHNLGKPPRHLVLLHLDGSAEERPETGDPVLANGRTVGRIGTVVDHFEDGVIALALVKRSITTDTPLAAAKDTIAASIDPDSVPNYDVVQAGRAAVERLRQR